MSAQEEIVEIDEIDSKKETKDREKRNEADKTDENHRLQDENHKETYTDFKDFKENTQSKEVRNDITSPYYDVSREGSFGDSDYEDALAFYGQPFAENFNEEEFLEEGRRIEEAKQKIEEARIAEEKAQAQEAMQILEEKQKLENKKEFAEEILNNSTPEQAIYATKKALDSEGIEKAKDSLEILEEMTTLKEELKHLETEQGKEMFKQSMQETSQETKDKPLENQNSTENTELNPNSIDEMYLKRKQQITERIQELEENFDRSVEKLIEAKDINEILKALYKMDYALSSMKKESNKIQEQEHERRMKEWLETFAKNIPEELKGKAKEFLVELYEKKTQATQFLKTAEMEKSLYYKLDDILSLEHSENKLKAIGEITKEISEKTPNFENKYPKITQKTKEYLAQNLQNTQEQSQSKGITK
ncbi:hypothetical protein [Helicobacter winghamensis]|uniref:hypothetical protein n=1 Tax=Helicobacter winghamensis TaxID=157268 RepID=UPI00279927C7